MVMSNRVSLVIPEQLLHELDRIRGDVPRSVVIRRLIEKAIDSAKKGGHKK